ncbi:DUF904 domain-containing protein [Undibacterium griseum]|nr:DUF904 domain-containing protein [Undibacterium griseum]
MMISDFELLAEKVAKLAELTHSLRTENAGLRHELASLNADNQELRSRMQQAHDRVAALLSRMPAEVIADEDAA